jgi:hypothetical protein
MLTDGHPTHGSTRLTRERARARAMGVRIHTVFIVDGAYPRVLAARATDTGGARFQALPDARRPGVLTLVDFGRDGDVRANQRVAARRLANRRDGGGGGDDASSGEGLRRRLTRLLFRGGGHQQPRDATSAISSQLAV